MIKNLFDYSIEKQSWLKSLLEDGQKRLPRKLKKKYLKSYSSGYFSMINTAQFDNLYRKDEETVKQSIQNMLNTPIEERLFKPNYGAEIDRFSYVSKGTL